MADGLDQQRSQPSHLRTFVWLAILVVGAFALRSAFSAQSGFDAGSHRQIFTGNDPYYHWQTVTHVVETGRNLNFDPIFNYPEGNWNPNPPLWTWTTAPLAQVMKGLHVADPVGTALDTMVAVWGALCVIPVFMVAKDLWGRKAGLWAAFFMAISGPAIQRSIWGYADHDAISTFYILLAVAFLVRGFRQMESATYISKWSSGSSVAQGLRNAVRANRNTLVYAALAGISITACAVTWKGYPYALAILAVAAFFQLVLDHLRNRDSTVTWMAYLITTAIAALLPWLLYYQAIGQHFGTTVQPSLYVLGGLIAVGLVLVPTRNLPSVLVFPALILGGLLGFVALFVYLPHVAYVIFSGLGYFSQSKLYSTIAEAQRPPIGDVAANLGFFSFLAAFWGLAHCLRRAYRGQAPFVLVGAWAAVSVFLMFAATRFINNAAPVFCVLMGFVMVKVIDFARTADVRKKFRAKHGQNIASRSLTSLTPRSTAVLGLGFLLLVLPNVWIGSDAAMGFDFERSHGLYNPACSGSCVNHFGAFGISQELGPEGEQHGWLGTMQALAKLDTCKSDPHKVCQPGDADYQDVKDRPAFIAWWDYGHWATGIGRHPTVADPFQSHYELSGRFLASDSEAEAMDWLSLLLLTGDWQSNQGHYSKPVQDLLARPEYSNLSKIQPGYWYDPQIKVLRGNVSDDKASTLYEDLVAATGHFVGYIGVDRRMGPFADGNDYEASSGILYAPVFLANKNPDTYVQSLVTSGGQVFTVTTYEPDPNGGFRHAASRYFDQNGQEYVDYQGRLYTPGHTPLQDPQAGQGIQLDQRQLFHPTQAYSSTMFARAYGGANANSTSPGSGLSHWRAIYQDVTTQGSVGIRNVVLLQYYHGISVSGTVLDDAGQPMKDVQVAFVDSFGGRHGAGQTNATGAFHATAPFSMGGDVKLQVFGADGSVLLTDNTTVPQYTEAQARAGGSLTGIQLTVARGHVSGLVYVDNDKAGTKDAGHYNANNDTLLPGATVKLEALTATANAQGNYTLGPLQAGSHTLSVSLAGYDNATAHASVPAGATAFVDIALKATPSQVTATFQEVNGTGVQGIPITFTGPTTTAVTTGLNGTVSATLAPGHYDVLANGTKDVGGTKVHFYAKTTLDVPLGGKPIQIVITRQEPPA